MIKVKHNDKNADSLLTFCKDYKAKHNDQNADSLTFCKVKHND